jgi:hypothetical protein
MTPNEEKKLKMKLPLENVSQKGDRELSLVDLEVAWHLSGLLGD